MTSELVEFNIVEATGSPYDCGYAHGKALKSIIQNIISLWAKNIFALTNLTLDQYAKKIKQETYLFKTIQNLAPDLLEEVHGIADGAELPHHIMEAWQYLDEHEWFIKDFVLGKKTSEENGCSTFGFKNTNQIIMGQNLDIPTYKDGIQTILKIKDKTGLKTVVFTQAGAIASLAINNSPLAICVNSLTQLAYRPDGLPVTYIIRKIMQNKNLEDAALSLKALPHATGHNYLIGSDKGYLNFECSANKVSLIENANQNYVSHTNHILVNQDVRPITPKEKQESEQRIKEFSQPRFQCLIENLQNQKNLSLSNAQKLLATQPVSISAKRNLKQFTFISAIFELSRAPKIWATPGAPEEYTYAPVEF